MNYFFNYWVVLYFDPGFGSMIIQWIVAGAAFLGVAIATMRHQIMGWFGRGKKATADEADGSDDDFERVSDDD